MLSCRIGFVVALTLGTLWPRVLPAQAIELSGGVSSLYDSQGGDITVHAHTYDLTGGLGFLDGHLMEGLHAVRTTSFGQSLAGDFRFPFRLPTDIFDSSHFLLARGVGARLIQPTSEILGFAGVTSLGNSSPFFEGAQGEDPACILMAAKTVSRTVDLFSDTVLAQKFTQLAAVNWTPASKLHLALAGGIGSNAPYFAASAQLSRPKFDAQAGYFAASSTFQRAFVPSPLLAEPIGGNVQVTIRPAPFFSFTASHQEYLVPASTGTEPAQSQVDEGSLGVRVRGTQLNASVFASTYTQDSGDVVQNDSVSITAMRSFSRRYEVMTSLLASRPFQPASTSSVVTNVSETINPRLKVSENITFSNGTANINFGGAFLSNLLEASAGYETFYIPSQASKPLQQSLILDAKLTVFGRLVLHGASVVDPMGKMRYTVDARTVLSRNHIAAAAPERVPMGDYVVSGHVLTASGTPVDGAALQIDEAVLYTDSEGRFLLRESRKRMHSIKVLTSEFLNEGRWEVVSDPGTLPSVLEASQQGDAVIVLRHPRPS